MALALTLAGCASGGVGKMVDKTLQSVGLRDASPTEKTIPLRLYAGENLNAGNDGRASATVVKLYQLRDTRRFESAVFDTFLDEARETAELGDTLVSVNEVVLTPGMRKEIEERLSPDATAFGVVALFRAPANGRWRTTFDTADKALATQGITLGVHACALSTSSPGLRPAPGIDATSLVSVSCMEAR